MIAFTPLNNYDASGLKTINPIESISEEKNCIQRPKISAWSPPIGVDCSAVGARLCWWVGLRMKLVLALTLYTACHVEATAQSNAYEVCSADSGSYSDISLCGKENFEKSEAQLNQIYEALLEALNDDEPRRKLVIESQRAWQIYREKSCKYWLDLLSYQVSWCMFGITDQRLGELRHMHACLVEGGNEC